MQTFQRQRAQRLVVRMLNFGYNDETVKVFVQTLFLSRLHNKDLWKLCTHRSESVGVTCRAHVEP